MAFITHPGRVAIVCRDDGKQPAPFATTGLAPVLSALAGFGLAVEPVLYSDARAGQVRDQLVAVDGILVWVNPVSASGDRAILDAILREAARAGVWVGAHPDVIALMATKEVLVSECSSPLGATAGGACGESRFATARAVARSPAWAIRSALSTLVAAMRPPRTFPSVSS